MDIKVGDYIGCYNSMWRGKRPYKYCLQVVAIGKKYKCVNPQPRWKNEGFKLLNAGEILRVFENKEIGDMHMEVAYEMWNEGQKSIDAAISNRDASVLVAIST